MRNNHRSRGQSENVIEAGGIDVRQVENDSEAIALFH